MKSWLKVLMWFGLGAGLGFFGGYSIGRRQGYKDGTEDSDFHEHIDQFINDHKTIVNPDAEKVFNNAINDYRGDIETDDLKTVEGLDKILKKTDTDEEEPEMPTAEDIQIDPDIPQLHPQDLIPQIISEEEFNINIWQYELENLLFYELDEVLYNEATQSIIECPDQVIGIGTLFAFGGDPNNPVETIYVKNDTFGTLFRIDRLDAAFCDAVDGTASPTDEDEPDDPGERDDFWNDV